MKNKFGVISLIISFVAWIGIYLFQNIDFGQWGLIFLVGGGVPYILAIIITPSLLLFFCIRTAIKSLRSGDEFKAYPILALIIIFPILLILIWTIFNLIQALVQYF